MSVPRDYEALVILKSAGTEDDLNRHAAGVDALVKKVGGVIGQTQQLGRRRLAFPIARCTEGHYYLVRFRAPTEQVQALERQLHLNETIVRFIVLTTEQPA